MIRYVSIFCFLIWVAPVVAQSDICMNIVLLDQIDAIVDEVDGVEDTASCVSTAHLELRNARLKVCTTMGCYKIVSGGCEHVLWTVTASSEESEKIEALCHKKYPPLGSEKSAKEEMVDRITE